MINQNTRRGFTQINKKGHSRVSLSGIYNACRCQIKENALLNGYVEDPRQKPSGMTPNFITARGFTPISLLAYRLGLGPTGAASKPENIRYKAGKLSGHVLTYKQTLNKGFFMAPLRSGFTLIELLVVVLIIGILAAVALPQYQKAVEKSRVSEALVTLDALGKCMSLYVLENGIPQGTVDIQDMNCSIEVGTKDSDWLKTSYYQYDATCSGSCYIEAEQQHAYDYVLTYSPLEEGTRICWTNKTTIGQAVCKSLEAQGWKYTDVNHP